VVLAIALLALGRWLTEAGFSGLWGAFTFPLSAFATALVMLSNGQGGLGVVAMCVLLAASGVVPFIAYRILKLWAQGTLAAKTNAAEA
jgi:tellurite resistance protein